MRSGCLVQIGDRKYATDIDQMIRRPTPAVRQQVDQGGEPGEHSLSNEGIWRRTGRDFILGAGQEWFDEPDESSRLRFWSSKGIYPWDRRMLRLLPTAESKRSSVNTNLFLLTVGTTHLYLADGDTAYYTTNPTAASPTFTATTGTPAGNDIWSLTSDGNRVYIGYLSGGIYRATPGGAASSFSAQNVRVLQYANGRLIAGLNNVLYEIDSAGAASTIYTHPNTSFVWSGITPAPNGIYVFGTAGEKTEVYLITVPDATGALSAPVWAVGLPDGERLYSMGFYGGVMIMFTSKGVRLAQLGGSGFLVLGPAILVGNGLSGSLEPQAEFCWFSWNNYDGTSTGLGRLKLDRFTSDLVPAYASDLMATAQGIVQSVVTFGDRRYFTVQSVGVFGETTTKVASGTYSSGWITYGVPERKSIAGAELRHDALPAGSSIAMALEEPDGTSTAVLTSSTTSALEKAAEVSGVDAESVRVNLTLTRSSDTSLGPRVTRWSLRSLPMPFRSEEIYLPVFLKNKVADEDGPMFPLDTLSEWQYLKSLEAGRTRVTASIGDESLTVVVDEVQVPEGGVDGWNDNRDWVETTAIVKLVAVKVT